MLSDWLVTDGDFLELPLDTSTITTTISAITSTTPRPIARPLPPPSSGGGGAAPPGGGGAPPGGGGVPPGGGGAPGPCPYAGVPPGGGSGTSPPGCSEPSFIAYFLS